MDEALQHAIEIMTTDGVGALTISEMARRMGIRPPSLYKYFASVQAVYDALFSVGLQMSTEFRARAVAPLPRGVPRIRAGATAVVRWAVENPALAQLLFWRPVPGFAPSVETLKSSVDDMRELRAEFAEAVALGELAPEADSDSAVALLTVVLSGLLSQQMANEPGAAFDEGRFTQLTRTALDMYFSHYSSGGNHAGPGS